VAGQRAHQGGHRLVNTKRQQQLLDMDKDSPSFLSLFPMIDVDYSFAQSSAKRTRSTRAKSPSNSLERTISPKLTLSVRRSFTSNCGEWAQPFLSFPFLSPFPPKPPLISVFLAGKSDPYAIVTFERFRYKSKTIKNTLNPVWDETFEFEVNTKDTDSYSFLLFVPSRTSFSLFPF